MSNLNVLCDFPEYIELSNKGQLGKIKLLRTYIGYKLKRWLIQRKTKKLSEITFRY